jgi:hypothetical protein
MLFFFKGEGAKLLLAEKSWAPLTFFRHIAKYLYFTHKFGTLLGKKKKKKRFRQRIYQIFSIFGQQ